MKKVLNIILALIPMVAMAQVENTPFEKGIKKTWEYVQSIGYNTNIEVSFDTTEVKIYGQRPYNKVYKHLKAKNPTDNSMVDIVIQLDEQFGNTMWNVLYTWKNKKLMPKHLKGIKESDFWIDDFHKYHLVKDGYKNSYAVGLVGNPNRPLHFCREIDSFSFSFTYGGIPYIRWY